MKFSKTQFDYSLYLVTDSGMLPEGKTLYDQVEAGLQNGVSLVQIREKDADTKFFIEEALAIKELCHSHNVPLIINDRVDVAIAIGADGVHVGQDDMPIPMVRKLVGPDMVIGWSVGFAHEVDELAQWGPEMVDYIGIGTLFATQTKKNPKKAPMGPAGAIRVLDALERNNASWCRTVGIGGLHPDNIERVLYQCVSSNGKRSLDGISVVSDIVASSDAGASTKVLRSLLDKRDYKFVELDVKQKALPSGEDFASVLSIATKTRPLIQHITNKVHQNFGANVTLALQGSPIMSEIESEVRDLASIPNATLLLNTGSVAPIDMVKSAIRAYNDVKRPIIFDPVGYSATETRLTFNNTLLALGQYSCIKGNSSEIIGLSELDNKKMKGVDATAGLSLDLLIKATRIVAFKYKTIAVCTGPHDIIADGTVNGKYTLSEGTPDQSVDTIPCVTIFDGEIPIMGDITASGCSLGSTIACMIGGQKNDSNLFHAVVTAVLLFKTAGKIASERCNGSGSFHVELIDALYRLSHDIDPNVWTPKLTVV
ncbi:Thiamine biosynthetic bifunctional enzyme [Nakaseomyces bracarensis]|uniref:Thiamine biosynthetic bifunctional enzyme n=1 Tax=Nakaseomyces bracarensis TaxID=273131 RepID=A0ABR4NLX9_9SACH